MSEEETPIEEVETKKVYYLVTDRKALNHNKLTVNPMPMAVNGKTEYVGDAVLDVDDFIICVEDDGSIHKQATITILNRRDGVVQITESLLGRLMSIGAEMGVIDLGD